MIGIIDYGMGNILSVKNALESLGAEVKICQNPKEIEKTEKLVLPGVGSFGDCIKNLTQKDFVNALQKSVIIKKKQILGICLGMQVMAKKSYEGGDFDGLGWFDAEVEKIKPSDSSLRIPHVGWNNLKYSKETFIFKNLPESFDTYFVHSYYMNCKNKEEVVATFEYGGNFTAAIQKDNIVAMQFHPEKSQDYGMTILDNFLRWRQ